MLFAGTGVLFLLFDLLVFSSSLDINIHDTYFVLPSFHVTIFHLLVYGFFGFCYWGFQFIRRSLGRTLSLFHYFITTLAILIFALSSFFVIKSPVIFSQDKISIFSSIEFLNFVITSAAILLLFAQIIFILNICLSIFRKPSRS